MDPLNEDFRRRSLGKAGWVSLRAARLRHWNRVGVAGFLAALTAGIGAAFIRAGLLASVSTALAVISCAAFVVALVKILTFSCPNCGRLYSIAGMNAGKGRNNGRKCVHCAFDVYDV